MASVRELAIKVKTGKLDLGFSFDNLSDKLSENAMIILAVEFSHIQSLNALELHHRDPFDRMIIAQSIAENLTIISKDKNF